MEESKIANTDNVCNPTLEINVDNIKNTSYTELKEAINHDKTMYKKSRVALPSHSQNKKCASQNNSKKARLHPIGSKLKIIIQIVITVSLFSSSSGAMVPKMKSPNYEQFFKPTAPPRPTTPAFTSSPRTQPMSWAQWSRSINKLIRMINGNGRRGYNIGLWNCRRNLIDGEKSPSAKMIEVKQFLQNKHLHVLCLVESDIHSPLSRYIRRHPLNTSEVHSILHVPGYKISLPKSWQVHGQARIIIFTREELQVKIRDTGVENSDLPTLTIEIGMGREKRTVINYFYREFTGGVSGLDDNQSQVERLTRQIGIWKSLCLGTKDFICMGDANICALKWFEEGYKPKDLSDMVQNFLVESACVQIVKENTRSEIVQGGNVAESCIDHCYTNVPDKVSNPEVVAVGNSDHLGVVVRKFAKVEKSKPNTVLKRSYKNFKPEDFLTDVLESDINNVVTASDDLDFAA